MNAGTDLNGFVIKSSFDWMYIMYNTQFWQLSSNSKFKNYTKSCVHMQSKNMYVYWNLGKFYNTYLQNLPNAYCRYTIQSSTKYIHIYKISNSISTTSVAMLHHATQCYATLRRLRAMIQ